MKFKHIAYYEFITDPANLLEAIRRNPVVDQFLTSHPNLASDIDELNHRVLLPSHKVALLKVVLAGQGDVVFAGWEKLGRSDNHKKALADYLIGLDTFYGITAYFRNARTLIDINKGVLKVAKPAQKLTPTQLLRSYNLTPEQKLELKRAVLAVFESFERTCQAWVIGGKADRLGFIGRTGKPLPQGFFPVDVDVKRRTLFELYFHDLLALSALYYHYSQRIYKQPVAAMTSVENDGTIKNIFVDERFYGYGRSNILTAPQPLVPVMGEDKKTCMDPANPYKILTKPHGHGDFYKVMEVSGIFEELARRGIDYLMMRQVNNPLAAMGTLEALGVLLDRKKEMVFLTIPRRTTAPEGCLVQSTRTADGRYIYSVYNVEYSELEAAGIKDVPVAGTEEQSAFGGNLNSFAARISSIRKRLAQNPFPGELINLKKPVVTVRDGNVVSIKADRLEAQMQGVAQMFEIESDRELSEEELAGILPVVTFDGVREDIFYVSKASPDIRIGDINDTPLTTRKALIDRRVRWLLDAGMDIPHRRRATITGEEYPEALKDVVVFLSTVFAFNPEILQAKVKGGRIGPGSYLEVDGEHVYLENVDLEGSLVIRPDHRIGTKEDDGEETPDPLNAGKVTLRNVTVRNDGYKKKWVRQMLVPGLEERKEGVPYPHLTREQARDFGLPAGDNIKYGINPEIVAKHIRNLERIYESGEYGENNPYLKILRTHESDEQGGNHSQKWGYALIWTGEYEEDMEEVNIEVEGNGEFFAENVTLEGNMNLKVPSGHKMNIHPSPTGNVTTIIPITNATWHYTVRLNENPKDPTIFEVERVIP